jgi:hypothetical protein
VSTTILWVQATTLTGRGITLRPLKLDDEAKAKLLSLLAR